jgi:hypothetical protein
MCEWLKNWGDVLKWHSRLKIEAVAGLSIFTQTQRFEKKYIQLTLSPFSVHPKENNTKGQ